MEFSRRSFMKWAASASTLAVATPSGAKLVPLLNGGLKGGAAASQGLFRPELLPSQKDVWHNMEWMAQLGPKYTGNKAHKTFIDFLEAGMQKLGLEVSRDHYTLPLWEAGRTGIKITTASGETFEPKVTSYFPRSGETPAGGVTGELQYVGSNPGFFGMKNLKGKIALADFVCGSREWEMMYDKWGVCPAGAPYPKVYRPARGAINRLAEFKDAGALGVILAWTDVSDANAQDQYSPFSGPLQGIPTLYVGRESGVKLSRLASAGAKATVTLEATITPDTTTDSVYAVLPGMSSKEAVVVHTHTDGPNATEENGAVAILAMAEYFSKIPKSERPRDMVFPLHTGHFAGPWVPANVQGVLDKHPDLLPRTVAAFTIEHLGCREWMDDATLTHYKPTGENDWSPTITKHKAIADLAMDALQGSSEVHRTAVLNPLHENGWFGVGPPFGIAGVPSIQYIPQPNYLCVGAANGCIDKLSSDLFYSQLVFFTKIVHKTNTMTAAQLKGQ
jgi:hypothetical protein